MVVCLLLAALFGTNKVKADTVDAARSVIDGIAMFKMSESGTGDLDEWAQTRIPEGAGTVGDSYAYALFRLGKADVSKYGKALEKYLEENEVRSGTTRLKLALCMCMTNPGHGYIDEAVESSVGKLGIMSLVYGLHLANNGFEGEEYSADRIVYEILGLRHPDGGWSVMGENSDVDVTAMVLQAFAGTESVADLSGMRGRIEDGITTGLRFLSKKQNDNGDYAGFGTDNAESTAQVIIALSSLGVDAARDERFVKNGNSVIDGMMRYRLPDGSFEHIGGGGSNSTATSQAFTAMASYICFADEKGAFYVLPGVRETRLQNKTGENSGREDGENKEGAEATGDEAEKTKGSTEESGEKPVKTAEAGIVTEEKTPGNTEEKTEENTTVTTEETGKNTAERTPGNTEEKEERTGAEKERDADPAWGKEDTSGAGTTGRTGQEKEGAAGTEPEENVTVVKTADGLGYKTYAYLGILAATILAGVLFCVFKKRNYKNFIFIGIAALLATAVVFFTDIRTESEYYTAVEPAAEEVGRVTLSIRCDTIAGLSEDGTVPEDGCILDTTAYGIGEGETVYDVLVRAVRENRIHMENKKTGSGAKDYYICGIANIYEYDWGELSGWMYCVNGESPSVGCGDYVLSDGDVIEWLYTREIGRDLKNPVNMYG